MAWADYLHNYMQEQERADSWHAFHHRFMDLAREEQAGANLITDRKTLRSMDQVLRGYCDYHEHPEIWAEKGKPEQGIFCLLKRPETGLWSHARKRVAELSRIFLVSEHVISVAISRHYKVLFK